MSNQNIHVTQSQYEEHEKKVISYSYHYMLGETGEFEVRKRKSAGLKKII